jgi:hypothetical protein
MLVVRGDAQTLPSQLNTAATGEVWFDPIPPKTDGVDVGTVVFSPGATEFHEAVTAEKYTAANESPAGVSS